MKATFENLIKLETKAKISCWNAKNFRRWNETIGDNYRHKWNKMVLELRGWNDCESNETKPEWIEFCDKEGAVYDYNFGDVIC
jgi:hypothetical protein